jgi:hypothetical protein
VEDANSTAAVAMVVIAVIEDSLVDSEQALEEAMEVMAMDSRTPAVVLTVIREVGHSSARVSHAVVNTNNRVGVATSSRNTVASVVRVEAYISMP